MLLHCCCRTSTAAVRVLFAERGMTKLSLVQQYHDYTMSDAAVVLLHHDESLSYSRKADICTAATAVLQVDNCAAKLLLQSDSGAGENTERTRVEPTSIPTTVKTTTTITTTITGNKTLRLSWGLDSAAAGTG